jgi:hypothetical protein
MEYKIYNRTAGTEIEIAPILDTPWGQELPVQSVSTVLELKSI